MQIVKCTDQTCCSKMRSSWLNVVPTRFLRAPIPIDQSKEGLKVPNQQEHDGKSFAEFLLMNSLHMESWQNIEKLPYDYYCPTVKLEVTERTCKYCGIYFCSKKAVKVHQRIHIVKKSTQSETPTIDEDNNDIECDLEKTFETTSADECVAPLVTIENNMQSTWVEDDQ